MVKIRNIRPPAPAAQRPSTGSPRRSGTARGSAGSGGIVLGTVGWILASAFLVLVILSSRKQQTERRRIQADLVAKTAEIQASVETRQEQISQRKQMLEKQINGEIEKQEKALAEMETLKRELAELDPDVAELERSHSKLNKGVAALQEDVAITGEGLQDLRDRLRKLEGRRDALKEEYRRRFQTMKQDFDTRKKRSEPEALRQFYGSHGHTVFAPAAGFFAAEKLYVKKRSKEALRLYNDVLRKYPDSPYAEECKGRIERIRARQPYVASDPPIGFRPHHVRQSGAE